MKSGFFTRLIIISVMVSGCNTTNKVSYQLKDTWGANGNWDSTSIAKVNKSPTKVKNSRVKSSGQTKMAQAIKPKTDTIKMKKSDIKSQMKDVSQVAEKAPLTEDKNIYKWEKVGSGGILKANYIKSIPDDNLGFSYGMINNTKVDAKFKTDYKKKLVKSIAGSSIVSEKEETIKNKKAWSLVFNYDKEGTKVQQKQLFIPIDKNVMLVNFVASQKGFSVAEPEFKSITSNLKL